MTVNGLTQIHVENDIQVRTGGGEGPEGERLTNQMHLENGRIYSSSCEVDVAGE